MLYNKFLEDLNEENNLYKYKRLDEDDGKIIRLYFYYGVSVSHE
jgi:hypothetical protein